MNEPNKIQIQFEVSKPTLTTYEPKQGNQQPAQADTKQSED